MFRKEKVTVISGPKWLVQLEGDSVLPVSDDLDVLLRIEMAFQDGSDSASFEARGQSYTVMFDRASGTHTQVNNNTGMIRALVRKDEASHALHGDALLRDGQPPRPTTAEPMKWEKKAVRGGRWAALDAKASGAIEKAFAKGERVVDVEETVQSHKLQRRTLFPLAASVFSPASGGGAKGIEVATRYVRRRLVTPHLADAAMAPPPFKWFCDIDGNATEYGEDETSQLELAYIEGWGNVDLVTRWGEYKCLVPTESTPITNGGRHGQQVRKDNGTSRDMVRVEEAFRLPPKTSPRGAGDSELILFTVTFCANSANDLTCPPSYIVILKVGAWDSDWDRTDAGGAKAAVWESIDADGLTWGVCAPELQDVIEPAWKRGAAHAKGIHPHTQATWIVAFESLLIDTSATSRPLYLLKQSVNEELAAKLDSAVEASVDHAVAAESEHKCASIAMFKQDVTWFIDAQKVVSAVFKDELQEEADSNRRFIVGEQSAALVDTIVAEAKGVAGEGSAAVNMDQEKEKEQQQQQEKEKQKEKEKEKEDQPKVTLFYLPLHFVRILLTM